MSVSTRAREGKTYDPSTQKDRTEIVCSVPEFEQEDREYKVVVGEESYAGRNIITEPDGTLSIATENHLVGYDLDEKKAVRTDMQGNILMEVSDIEAVRQIVEEQKAAGNTVTVIKANGKYIVSAEKGKEVLDEER